jgi:hypothetical protein
MRKSGNSYTFSDVELRTILQLASKAKLKDYRGDLEEILLSIMGFSSSEIDNIEDDSEEDIDDLVNRIITNPSRAESVRREVRTRTSSRASGGCGGVVHSCGGSSSRGWSVPSRGCGSSGCGR